MPTVSLQPMLRALPVVLGALTFVMFAQRAAAREPSLDGFARCLTRSGATMYGASWCRHCKAERAKFGNAVYLLRYVECSEGGTPIQTPRCDRARIKSYPTWEFRDGSRLTGQVALSKLSEKTGCSLDAETGKKGGPAGQSDASSARSRR